MSGLHMLSARERVGFDYASLAKGAFGALSAVGTPAQPQAQQQQTQQQQAQPAPMGTVTKVLLGVGIGLGVLLVGAIALKLLRQPVMLAAPAAR